MIETPLSASATSVGAFFSGNTFSVPPFQREYAWEVDEVREFWEDLSQGMDEGAYFLGLFVLTDDEGRKHVVDGQQRILTLTLLAAALYHEAVRHGRNALADRIQADFLKSINYETDEQFARVRLSNERDNSTLEELLESSEIVERESGDEDVSARLVAASEVIRQKLATDLDQDPFRRLGAWADYLTNQVYVASFVHPDPASAYRVFEVINTRGKDLTTAELLKNYILSQTPARERTSAYNRWQSVARPLSPQDGPVNLVQFIRHVATLRAGHVAPKDLYSYLARGRAKQLRSKRKPPSVPELMDALEGQLPLYLQMVDPTVEGPADPEWLAIFSALRDLGVITVRPLLMALSQSINAKEGMESVLRLVVRRIVVGNLGTGNVERRLSEAAYEVAGTGDWVKPLEDLDDLNHEPGEFVEQLRKRSFNKATLGFLHRCNQQNTITPTSEGTTHLIRPRQATDWHGFPDDEFAFWGSTMGNTFLASVERRPPGASSWDGFKNNLLPYALTCGDLEDLEHRDVWSTAEVEERGMALAEVAAKIWFPERH